MFHEHTNGPFVNHDGHQMAVAYGMGQVAHAHWGAHTDQQEVIWHIRPARGKWAEEEYEASETREEIVIPTHYNEEAHTQEGVVIYHKNEGRMLNSITAPFHDSLS